MDTQKLENTVNTILQEAIAKAQEGTEFLKDQIPDVVQQLLTWNLARNLFWLGIWIIISLTGFVISHRIAKANKNDESFWDEPNPKNLTVIIGRTITGCVIFTAFPFLEILEIWLAPKVWLLEYAAHLVKH